MSNHKEKNAFPEVRTDKLSRTLYAQDASMYEEMPEAVAFPKSAADIKAIVTKCASETTPITARAAGTSLAGQTTGGGIIMDTGRFMDEIIEVDAVNKTARVQPGVIRDVLNASVKKHKLLFGPDTSTTNRCMLGGMIGNNSSGSFSIQFGTTRDQLHSVNCILSDGSEVVFGPLSDDELSLKRSLATLEGKIYDGICQILEQNTALIREKYPHASIIRRNTGYALDVLLDMSPFTKGGPPFNLAKFICGSEGTLAMTTEATVTLSELDSEKILVVPQFHSIRSAMEATVRAVAEKPSAVELIDHIIMDATKGNREHVHNRFFLEGEPNCLLIIELSGNDALVLKEKAKNLQTSLLEHGAYAAPILDDADEMRRVWDLRKAGLGLLMGLASDAKTPTFCEDTAVRVEDLPNYIDEFTALIKKHNTSCVYYAHASVGELHLRPVINLKKQEGLETMKVMAEEVAHLVAKYKGSLSGEHGDGRARAPYMDIIYGNEVVQLFEQVKDLFDPKGIFNPGKIVRAKPIDHGLRFDPSYVKPTIPTVFKFKKELGFVESTEMCNGAGVCRKLSISGGTMCPSYMATKDEKDSTRGRANIFRKVFEGENPEGFKSKELKEALSLCLSCKACKTECPANVDMARMKSEFDHGRHLVEGLSLAERFYGDAGKVYPLAQKFAPIVNAINRTSLMKSVLESAIGLHKSRTLPDFETVSFKQWWKKRQADRKQSTKKVLLFVDLFTNAHESQIAKDALTVIEALGYEVALYEGLESGRPQLSKGLLDNFKQLAATNVTALTPYINNNYQIVGLEPSEILTLRDEYLDIFEDDTHQKAEAIAANSFMLEEFVLKHTDEQLTDIFDAKDEVVYVHGHCHAKALIGMKPLMDVLKKAGYQPIDLKTGCCGMAGSFGYQKANYEVSMQIGEDRLFPQLRTLDASEGIVAHGFSCRHQIKDGVNKPSFHTAHWLVKAMKH